MPKRPDPNYPDTQLARVPAILRVRGDQIVGIEDHKGNLLGMPMTATTGPDGGVVFGIPSGGAVLPSSAAPWRYGHVSARAGWNPYIMTSKSFATSVSFDYARDHLTELILIFQGAYRAVTGVGAADGKEYGLGDLQYECQIEYPIGTVYTTVTFSGSSVGICPSAGLLFSDPVILDIPKWALYKYRIQIRNLNGLGIIYTRSGLAGGDFADFGIAPLPSVLNGANTPSGSAGAGWHHRPMCVIQKTRTRAICVTGDSREQGYSDVQGAAGFGGQHGRALGPKYAMCNIAQYSDRLDWFLRYGNVHKVPLQFCTDVWTNYGINDLVAGGWTADQLAAAYTQFANSIGGRVLIPSTLTPKSSSSNQWIDLAGQTTDASNSKRVTFNSKLRSRQIPGVNAYQEVADIVESSRDSGLWRVNGTVKWATNDGTHETAASNTAISAAADTSMVFFEPWW